MGAVGEEGTELDGKVFSGSNAIKVIVNIRGEKIQPKVSS